MFIRNLWLEFNYFLFEITASKKSLIVTKVFLFTYFVLLLLDFDTAIRLYSMNNYVLFQVFFGFIFIMNSEIIASLLTKILWGVTFKSKKLQWYWPQLSDTPQKPVPTLDGCRLDDLIVHIINNNWLPTTETRNEFWLSHDQIKKLGDNLERVGIFTRGKNNARVLATRNYDKIIRVMKQASDSNQLPSPDGDDSSQAQFSLNDLKTALASA